MRWVRPAKLPILIAWLAIAGVLYYVGSHPELVAPYTSNLVSRHLLRLEEGGLRVRDFQVRTFEGLDLYGVSLTLPDSSGGLTLISADTVTVDFRITEALGIVPRLRQVTVRRPEVYSLAGRKREEKESGGPGIALPRLVIDNLTVTDAFLEFSDSGGRLAERIPQADWQGRLETGDGIRTIMRGCDIDWETHESHLEDLRGEVRIDGQGIFVENLSGKLNGNPVKGRGSWLWDATLDLTADAQGVSVDEVAVLIDQDLGFHATGDVAGTFNLEDKIFTYEGVFTGDLEGYQMTGIVGKATVTPDEVLLTDLAGNINGATFNGGGRFDISDGDSVSFVLEGDAVDADLSRGLIVGEEDLPRTGGVGRLRIEHTDKPMWTRVTGVMNDGFVEIMPFDNCLVDVEAFEDSVVFNRIEVYYGDLHAVLDGVSDTSQVFRGNISLNSENLGTLPPDWEWPELAGRMNGQGRLEGPLDNLGFVGWANIFGFGLGPIEAVTTEAVLVVDNVLGDLDITTGLEGRGLKVGGVNLGAFSLWGSASAAAARVDSFRASYGDTAVALDFQAAFSDSVNYLRVDRFQVDLEGTRWSLDDALNFTVGEGHLFVPKVRLASDQGAMTVNALYEADEVVAGSLVLSNFDLALLNPFLRGEHELAGRMTADVVVGGEPSAPQVNLTADLVDAPFPMADIHELHVAAAFSQGSIDFEQLDMTTNYGRVLGSGTVSHPGAGVEDYWDGADLDLDLTINNGDFTFLEQFALPALDRLAGTFDGRLTVGGSTDDPVIRGDITSAPFHIHWLHLDQLTGEVWVDRESMTLGNLQGRKGDLTMAARLEVPLELDLMSEPVTPLDGPFFMQLDIPWDSDLAPLKQATNAFIRSSGRGGAHLIVSGPLDHPLYQGTLEIKDAGFVLRNMEEIYREVSCEGVFRGDELRVFNIEGSEGLKGRFSGEGMVLFRGLVLETFDIRLDLDRFLIASIPDLAVVVSGKNTHMTGVKVGPDSLLVPKFTGSLEVDKGRYLGNFKESSGGNDPLKATVAPDWLADLHLRAGPRVTMINNREMNLLMGGDLNLIRDEQGLYLRGSLDINSGNLIVFNNSFQVTRGRLDFSRRVGFNPRVDLDATTRYRLRSEYSSNSIIETIGVHVGGTLLQPEISFTSERGYSREAIQRMLLGLEPHATPDGDRGNLTASSIGAGFNLLEREIARELDIVDTFEIDQIQRRNQATGDSGLDPLIGVGKYIGSDLYLKYAQGIRQDDRDFVVEYQINQHLLLQSEIRRRIDENQGESTYNLDFKYRFEY